MSKFRLFTPQQEYQLPSSSEYILPELELYILPTVEEVTTTEDGRYVINDPEGQRKYISNRLEEMTNMEGLAYTLKRLTNISAKLFDLYDYLLTTIIHPENITYVYTNYHTLYELSKQSLVADRDKFDQLLGKLYHKLQQ
jgi:hypothetical protein